MHAEAALLAQQARDVAVRVVNVAEMQRVGDAGIDASRCRARIDARREIVREAEIDPVGAERAFLRHAKEGRIGTLESEVLEEFWKALSIHAGATIHVDVIRGRNRHHVAEATFKALGLALRQAMALGGGPGVPSSKGLLG